MPSMTQLLFRVVDTDVEGAESEVRVVPDNYGAAVYVEDLPPIIFDVELSSARRVFVTTHDSDDAELLENVPSGDADLRDKQVFCRFRVGQTDAEGNERIGWIEVAADRHSLFVRESRSRAVRIRVNPSVPAADVYLVEGDGSEVLLRTVQKDQSHV